MCTTTFDERHFCFGYTRDELARAFERVENPVDWKAPIRAFVQLDSPADLGLYAAAIAFFTATWPTMTNVNGTDGYCIESVGYRAGPAGDH
jgi:hypothetical protein